MNLEPATLQINITKSDIFQGFLKSPMPFTQNSPMIRLFFNFFREMPYTNMNHKFSAQKITTFVDSIIKS
jgi:hypothetical protein